MSGKKKIKEEVVEVVVVENKIHLTTMEILLNSISLPIQKMKNRLLLQKKLKRC